MRSRSGFTMIEMSVTVGIIALLAGIVVVAVNPARRFAQTRNVQRQSDLEKILDAIDQYAIETNGSFPTAVSTTWQMIGTATSGCNLACTTSTATTANACANLSSLTPTYIQSLPFDPKVGSAAKTYYAIQRLNTATSGVGILLRSCSPELSQSIETRQ